MGRARRVWFPRIRAVVARAVRPACVRWPFDLGRHVVARRLVPTVAQIPVGTAARMRPGFRCWIRDDPVDRAIWLFGDFDPAETRAYARLLCPGDTVVDVGANFGWHTLGFARAVGAGGRVLAFEPVPASCAHLRANLALNGCEGPVTVRPVALGAAAGETVLYTFAGASLAEASGTAMGRADATPQRVPLATLDDELRAFGGPAPTLLKVDVEGFELDVFRGAARTLAGPDAPVLAFELNRTCLAHRGVGAAEIEAWCRAAGYGAFWRFDVRGGPARPVSGLAWSGPPDAVNVLAATPARVPHVAAAVA